MCSAKTPCRELHWFERYQWFVACQWTTCSYAAQCRTHGHAVHNATQHDLFIVKRTRTRWSPGHGTTSTVWQKLVALASSARVPAVRAQLTASLGRAGGLQEAGGGLRSLLCFTPQPRPSHGGAGLASQQQASLRIWSIPQSRGWPAWEWTPSGGKGWWRSQSWAFVLAGFYGRKVPEVVWGSGCDWRAPSGVRLGDT